MTRSALMKACIVAMLLVAGRTASAQFEPPVITKEHEVLKQFEGEWESESEGMAGPGQPAMKCKGTMASRMLGGLWIVSEMQMTVPGTNIHAVQTIGYNSDMKKFVGTWVDSAMNHMWHYVGTLDETGKILTLEAEGPNFTEKGKTSLFRDTYEFKSADHIVSSSSMRGDDGKWITFMTGNIRRKK